MIQRKQSHKRVIIKDENKQKVVFKTEAPVVIDIKPTPKTAIEGLKVKSSRELDTYFDEIQALRD